MRCVAAAGGDAAIASALVKPTRIVVPAGSPPCGSSSESASALDRERVFESFTSRPFVLRPFMSQCAAVRSVAQLPIAIGPTAAAGTRRPPTRRPSILLVWRRSPPISTAIDFAVTIPPKRDNEEIAALPALSRPRPQCAARTLIAAVVTIAESAGYPTATLATGLRCGARATGPTVSGRRCGSSTASAPTTRQPPSRSVRDGRVDGGRTGLFAGDPLVVVEGATAVVPVDEAVTAVVTAAVVAVTVVRVAVVVVVVAVSVEREPDVVSEVAAAGTAAGEPIAAAPKPAQPMTTRAASKQIPEVSFVGDRIDFKG